MPAQDRVSDYMRQWEVVRPDLDVTPMGVVGRLTRASEVVGRRLRDYFEPKGLTRSEFDVLATLRRSSDPYTLTPGELAHATMSSAATVTNRLNDLEKRGLLSRTVDPSNRRSVLVTLLPAGVELVDEVLAGHIDNENAALSSLTAKERDHLARLLAKLLHGLGDVSER